MTEYLMVGAVAVACVGGGYGYFQNQQNKILALEVQSVRGELLTCGARLENFIEDVRSDNAIDNIPDSDLPNVPDHWLREPATPGGN